MGLPARLVRKSLPRGVRFFIPEQAARVCSEILSCHLCCQVKIVNRFLWDKN
jgi:hypothetical protein